MSRYQMSMTPFAGQKVLLMHNIPLSRHRDPVFSENTIYFTPNEEKGKSVENFPPGKIDMAIVAEELRQRHWEPDLFVAKVDSFFRVQPINVSALKCPKALILGNTQNGKTPLTHMINYATSEKYDFYITDHKRHHLWFFHLAGILQSYWLPGLFHNPPVPGFQEKPYATIGATDYFFKDRPVFIGQFGEFHPRRQRFIERAIKEIPNFFAGMMMQADALKAYNIAGPSLNISLNGDLNLRFFEIISAAGLQFSDRLSDESGIDLLLDEDREVVLFDTEDEVLEKIRYYQDNQEENRKVRTRAFERYQREYAPEKILHSMDAILAGREIESRYNSSSLARIKYITRTPLSPARIRAYELVQEQHLVKESPRLLIDGQVDFAYPEDFLDLPRLEVVLINQTPESRERLSRYVEHAKDARRLKIVREVSPGDKFDVMIVPEPGAANKNNLRDNESFVIH